MGWKEKSKKRIFALNSEWDREWDMGVFYKWEVKMKNTIFFQNLKKNFERTDADALNPYK